MSFGLSMEKLVIIAVIAAFLIGPERLPRFTAQVARFARALRGYADSAKERVRDEIGPDFDDIEWKKLDPRQYDPRRIIKDALLEDSSVVTPTSPGSPESSDNRAP